VRAVISISGPPYAPLAEDVAWWRAHRPLVEAGRVKPLVAATFPLAEAAAAHRLMESSAHIGKIVLTL